MSRDIRLKLGIPETVNIPEDVLEKLKSVRPTGKSYAPGWTSPDIDEIVYNAFPKANKEDLAAALGVTPGTLRKRYRTLVKERSETVNPEESTDNNIKE